MNAASRFEGSAKAGLPASPLAHATGEIENLLGARLAVRARKLSADICEARVEPFPSRLRGDEAHAMF